MNRPFEINHRRIGSDHPTYIIAEMSANHNQDFGQAVQIIEAAKEAGADAIKLQTYSAETMTIDCTNSFFKIGEGTIWKGKYLFDLYKEACTPWEWQPKLKKAANEIGLDLFSTPFDATSVDFLEKMDVPAYKIASFEVVDIPLLRNIAGKRKPVIMSTGMATLGEIDEAVRTLRESGDANLALLKCTSAYPAPASEMNLKTIPHLAEAFQVVAGLSDHTLNIAVPVAAVALGARIIEKHITLSRSVRGPDSEFSLEPHEFSTMVKAIRDAESALGSVNYGVSEKESASRAFRRSLFVTKDMSRGEVFSTDNVRSIRPGYGLHPRYLSVILGKRSAAAIQRGTPLSWDIVSS